MRCHGDLFTLLKNNPSQRAHLFFSTSTKRETGMLSFLLRSMTTETSLQPGKLLKNEVIPSQPNVLMHTSDVSRSYFLQPFDLWSGNINQ